MAAASLPPIEQTRSQRCAPDRRRRPTPTLSRYWLVGRRRGGRRAGEQTEIYVDRYTGREWALILSVVGLAVADWVWTMRHLAHGIEEANPLFRWTLHYGGMAGFSVAKLTITACCAGFLLLHMRFRLARRLLPWALGTYVLLIGVHALATAVH